MCDGSRLFLVALSAFCSVAAPAGGSGLIGGTVFLGEPGRPVPAALVALYRGGEDTLIEFTYTTNSGQFVLPAIPAAGKLYLVATRDALTRRQDLDYDPGKGQRNIAIVLRNSATAWGAVWQVASKLGFIGSAFIGIFLGLIGKAFTDLLLFRVRLGYLRVLQNGIEIEHQTLLTTAKKMPSPPPVSREISYNASMRSVKALARDLEARMPDAFAVFQIRQETEMESYFSLRKKVAEIRQRAAAPFLDFYNAAIIVTAPTGRSAFSSRLRR
jgi:hypothetical protein